MPTPAPLAIGTRREPFFDGYLIEKLSQVSHELVDSVQTRCTFAFDRPWEGPYTGYGTVLRDDERLLLYYRGMPTIKAAATTCVAESHDGRTWSRPAIGLYPHEGRTDTNIIFMDAEATEMIAHNFTPFPDTNPAVKADERFKAVGGDDKHGLFALGSPDGIRWSKIQPGPVFTDGIFDSQNVPFWSSVENCYVIYFRIWTEGLYKGLRTIARTTSTDFRTWTKPEPMTFGDRPLEELYTNVTQPYPGAPHLYVALPSRFVMKRQWMNSEEARALGVQEGREGDVSDTVFMTSRGGTVYDRHFPQAYLRPGLDPQDWVGRNNMVALGLVQLDPRTLGFYRTCHYASSTIHLVLHTLRTDGFARLRAGRQKGRILTKPFVAAGNQLCLNFSTSAAGTIRIEVLDADSSPIAGFSGRAAPKIFGDSVHHPVKWSKQRSWSELAGRPLRLRFTLSEADLYALQQV